MTARETHSERERGSLRAILSDIGEAVIVTDEDGRVTFVNTTAERLTGWTAAEALDRPIDEVLTLDDDASRVGCDVSVIRLSRGSGAPGDVVLVLRDVGEWGRLATAGRRLAAIVESSDDAIVSKDLDGVVRTWNAGAERIFGYKAEEIIGRPIAILVPPERGDEEPRILERIRRGDRVDHYETVRVRKDGARINVSVTISPVKDHTGRIVGASKVARDITLERALREELQRRVIELREADRRKDEFLAMLAHELRNPLGAIVNALHLLDVAPEDAEVRERSMAVLRRQVQHQVRIVNELLDVSRITRGLVELRFGDLDVVRLVHDAAVDYRGTLENERVALELDLPEAPIWVRADATRLTQVIGNVLNNAAKFTPAGGKVTVAVRELGDGGSVEIVVADTGAGIDPELLPRVFDTFSQGDRTLARAQGGLGLGLAIVKGLVGLHSGEVDVTSEGSDRGTQVRIRLPVLRERAEASAEEPAPTRERHLRILIIEDEPDAAEMLQQLLKMQGHDVAVAYTGSEGVRMAREEHPDVVLCDLGLPGMDGYEVATALRTAPGGAKPQLIAITGYGQDQDRRRTLDAGFDHHLVKPVDLSDLEEALSSVAPAA